MPGAASTSVSRADRSGPASIRVMRHGTVSLPISPMETRSPTAMLAAGLSSPKSVVRVVGVRRDPGGAEHARPVLEAHAHGDHRPDLERVEELVEEERRDPGHGADRPHDAPAPVAPERHVVLHVDQIAALGNQMLDIHAERVGLRAQPRRGEPVAAVPPRERGVRHAKHFQPLELRWQGRADAPGRRRCRSP